MRKPAEELQRRFHRLIDAMNLVSWGTKSQAIVNRRLEQVQEAIDGLDIYDQCYDAIRSLQKRLVEHFSVEKTLITGENDESRGS